MAAYAALVSVMHIIEQIQYHPRPPISLDENQVQSLTENVTFLEEFLEVYSHVRNEEADQLQSCIADAAYAAEDVIESHIADQILAQSKNHVEEIGGSTADFYHSLQKVIQYMDHIREYATEIQEKMGSVQDVVVHRSSYAHAAGSSGSPSKGQNILVGLDGVLIQLMDKLTGRQSNRQIISIVGMGGIGKTTLAKNAYENPLIVQHFDICAWVTISQEYSMKEIILAILSCQKIQENEENLPTKSAEELGEVLHRSLFGRRYLIIMDDAWDIEIWSNLKFFFPDNNNRSRIVITTRQSNIALHLPSAFVIEMNFLDEKLSWLLLCKTAFGKDECPLELEEIGKQIARNCKGLPLSIVVIGGLLAKSEKTGEYWEDIAENLNSIVNLEDNERCFRLLYMSYYHLPVHLRPCFLYMGVFPEDSVVRVSDLIKLWVAEGFLKPIIGKSLEEVAEEYLKDLTDRNLILILEWKSNGKMKLCKIHGLLRDLCLREAQREEFLCVAKTHSFDNFSRGINVKRRIAIHGSIHMFPPQVHDALQFDSLARSLIYESRAIFYPFDFRLLSVMKTRLLRVIKTSDYGSIDDDLFRQVNLRYFASGSGWYLFEPFKVSEIPCSARLCWNLQTLSIRHTKTRILLWRMPLLRHVNVSVVLLPDHLDDFSSYCLEMFDKQNDFVFENLQTLSTVVNFRCSEMVGKMMPDIKKLKISYYEQFKRSRHCLNNLAYLHKLESLKLYFDSSVRPSRSELMRNLSFPHSLKKLTLEGCNLDWEDISIKIGVLPLLQVLKMGSDSFMGPDWETVEGQFLSLKILEIDYCSDLECWTTSNTHFPRLEHLVLNGLSKLKEIPSGIGEIPTLQSMKLLGCSDSAVFSAKDIVLEQEELGNDGLQVQVSHGNDNQAIASLASHNFQVDSGSCTIQ